MSEAGGDKRSNDYKNRVSSNGERRSETNIHTDKELAQMAGVGTGTVARFNKVVNSDDEDVKQRVLSGKTSISVGYNDNNKMKIGCTLIEY